MLYFDDVEVGWTSTVGEYEFKEDEIIRFAREWDPQPFHIDPEAAKQTPMGGITASACHIFSVAAWLMRLEAQPLAVIAGARHEFDLLQPARPGDRLSKVATCVEKRASRTKSDRGIIVYESFLRTQGGIDVAKIRSTLVVARNQQQ